MIRSVLYVQGDLKCQSQLHEAASDCLISALVKCEDMGRYGHLAQVLFERVLTLHAAYQSCAEQGDTDRYITFSSSVISAYIWSGQHIALSYLYGIPSVIKELLPRIVGQSL